MLLNPDALHSLPFTRLMLHHFLSYNIIYFIVYYSQLFYYGLLLFSKAMFHKVLLQLNFFNAIPLISIVLFHYNSAMVLFFHHYFYTS
jgi:hypothetical protein